MSVRDDDRGLVGKLLVLWLVLLGVVAVAVADGGSIVLTQLRTDDLARDAGLAAADRLGETGDRREAVRAALAAISGADEDARLKDLEISRGGDVTVVVTARADTLVVGRLGLLDELATVTASETTPADRRGGARA